MSDRTVAGNIRAELARRSMAGVELAAGLGWSRSRTSRLLSGAQPWLADELPLVAEFLDVPVADFYEGVSVSPRDSVRAS